MNPDNLIFECATIMASFLLALLLTGQVRRVLIRRAVLDVPNDRSSHKIPVPRGGGWALLGVIIPALGFIIFHIDGDLRHLGLVLGVLLLAAISWLDDRHHVSPMRRLSLHILAACLGSSCFAPDALVFGGMLPFWLDRTCMILGWAWFINLYNFMDGIDGITGVETIAVATGVCLVMAAAGIADPAVSFLTLVLTGACLGFLAYNWHPARLFLGDVGSVPLGYLTGFCLIALAVQGCFAAALILPLYYLADSGFTIVKRALRHERIWEAHRQHFYQHAALGVGRHDKVVIWITVANIALCDGAMLSVQRPWTGLMLGTAIVAVLLGKMHKAAVRQGYK